jgi:hypothetical protein
MAIGRSRLWFRLLPFLVLAVGTDHLTPKAVALEIFFQWGSGTLSITDNSGFDNNATTGIIDFGPVILPEFTVAGTLDLGSGPNLSSVIGNPSASLRLTNFTAEAIIPPQFPLRVGFRETLNGTYSNLIGGDAIDAYVGNSLGNAMPAGQNTLDFWQGYLNLLTFPPPFGPNPPIPSPALPAKSAPLAYANYGHGPSALMPGPYTNPILGADLYITLSNPGEQFILFSS